MQEALEKVSKQTSGVSIVLSILLIICGFLAIMLPVAMSVGVLILVAWLLIIGGVVQFVHAFSCKGIGHIIWKLLVAVCYVITGIYLRIHPLLGVATLTLVLAVFLAAEGLVDIIGYISTRKSGVSSWLLFDGIITLILGVMIWRQWPSGSLWVIGTLAGLNMIMTGFTRLMLTFAVRRAVKKVPAMA
jgi:uncharacterized membrane protein HdeD (DUF308 family)